jgi:hypothetical protein
MKKFLPLLIFCLLSSILMAQMPKVINYQAVARNSSGQPLANQTIGVRLSVVNTLAGNASLYSETRTVTTNSLGLFNIQFGAPGANAVTGNFNSVGWVNNTSSSKALKVELDINNSGSFVDMGAQSLVSVPYAFAADQAVDAINIGGHYVDTNTPQTGDVLKWSGSAWVPQPASVIYPVGQDLFGTVINGGNLAFVFVGTTQEVELKEGQVITTVLTATLGASSGTANNVGIAPGYQRVSPLSSVTAFNPFDYNTVSGISGASLCTVVGSLKVTAPGTPSTYFTIPAGTYRIGLVVRNTSAVVLNQNNTLNGFISIQ